MKILDLFQFYWGSVQVGRTRDRSQAVTLGIYSAAADISVCRGVDLASKNEYQDIPGGKGGRCVVVRTLPPSCAECIVIWSLNRPEPSGPHRLVIGVALPLTLPILLRSLLWFRTSHLIYFISFRAGRDDSALYFYLHNNLISFH